MAVVDPPGQGSAGKGLECQARSGLHPGLAHRPRVPGEVEEADHRASDPQPG